MSQRDQRTRSASPADQAKPSASWGALSSPEVITADRIKGKGAAALLVTEDGRYLMQHRDDIAGIWFPGYWGLFGGAIDAGETPAETLRRELAEEIGFRPEDEAIRYVSQVVFDLGDPAAGFRRRYFYEVPLSLTSVPELVLKEGQALGLFTARELLTEPLSFSLVPYDAFAIMLHHHRDLIRGSRDIP